MPKAFVIGKIEAFEVAVNFQRHRAIVRANTEKVPAAPQGIQLEPLEPGPNGFFPAMVLIHRDWRRQYFMREREGWTEDDYFCQAKWFMGKLGIAEP